MKKVLAATLLVLALVLAAGLASAGSKLGTTTIDGVTYDIYSEGDWYYYPVNNESVTLFQYNGSATVITLPSAFDGLPVTSALNQAIKSTFTKVTVPASFGTIPAQLFQGKTALQTVVLKSGITAIGENAFYSCSNLTSVSIASTVTEIGHQAFARCTSLTSIDTNGVEIIRDRAFFGCTGLTNVTFGDDLTTIEEAAFYNTGLTSVELPSGLTTIGQSAFQTASLAELDIPDGVTSIDLPVTANGCTLVVGDPSPALAKLLATESYSNWRIRGTSDYAEAGADATTVEDKVQAIVAAVITPGMSDYQKALALHDYLTQHAQYDVSIYRTDGYDPLGELKYAPDGVLLHGFGVCQSYATAYQLLLNEVGIPNDLEYGTDHVWNMIQLDGDWYHIDVTWDDPTAYGQNGNLEANVRSGRENHRYFCLTNYALEAVSQHECTQQPHIATAYALNYAYSHGGLDSRIQELQSEILNNLEAGNTTFTFTPATFKADLISETNSYYGILERTSLVVVDDMLFESGDVTYRVSSSYNGSSAGVTFTAEAAAGNKCGDSLYWELDGNTLTITGSGAMDDYGDSGAPWCGDAQSITEIILPEGLTYIGSFAFEYCDIGSIALPESLETIGDEAFLECSSLMEIHLPAGVTSVHPLAYYVTPVRFITVDEANTVYKAENNVLLTKDGTTALLVPFAGDVLIPEGVTALDENALAERRPDTLTIPTTLTDVDGSTFAWSRVGEYIVTDGNPSLRSTDGLLLSADGARLIAAGTAETSVTVPDSVTEIGSWCWPNAYYSMTCDLEEVTIPDSVTVFGDHAVPSGATIRCRAGSAADTYAQTNGNEVEYISDPLGGTVTLTQEEYAIGDTLTASWEITGGSGEYTVDVSWYVDEMFLGGKVLQESYTGSTGASSWTVDTGTTVSVNVKVTDSAGTVKWLSAQAYSDDYVESAHLIGRENLDYVHAGDPISYQFGIHPAGHTITDISYTWVIRYEDGTTREVTTSLPDAVAGPDEDAFFTASFDAAEGTRMRLSVDCKDERGFSGFDGFKWIQVLAEGEQPLDGVITFEPSTIHVGDTLTVNWQVTGASENVGAYFEWQLRDNTPSESMMQYDTTEVQGQTSGTLTLTPDQPGSYLLWLSVSDGDLDISRSVTVPVLSNVEAPVITPSSTSLQCNDDLRLTVTFPDDTVYLMVKTYRDGVMNGSMETEPSLGETAYRSWGEDISKPGTYTYAARIRNASGEYSDWITSVPVTVTAIGTLPPAVVTVDGDTVGEDVTITFQENEHVAQYGWALFTANADGNPVDWITSRRNEDPVTVLPAAIFRAGSYLLYVNEVGVSGYAAPDGTEILFTMAEPAEPVSFAPITFVPTEPKAGESVTYVIQLDGAEQLEYYILDTDRNVEVTHMGNPNEWLLNVGGSTYVGTESFEVGHYVIRARCCIGGVWGEWFESAPITIASDVPTPTISVSVPKAFCGEMAAITVSIPEGTEIEIQASRSNGHVGDMYPSIEPSKTELTVYWQLDEMTTYTFSARAYIDDEYSLWTAAAPIVVDGYGELEAPQVTIAGAETGGDITVTFAPQEHAASYGLSLHRILEDDMTEYVDWYGSDSNVVTIPAADIEPGYYLFYASVAPEYGYGRYAGNDDEFRFIKAEARLVLELPAGLTTIGPDAFAGVAADYIHVPSSVTSIDASAFSGDVILILDDDTLAGWCDENGIQYIIE